MKSHLSRRAFSSTLALGALAPLGSALGLAGLAGEAAAAAGAGPQSALADMGRAPEFTGLDKWLNTDQPLSISGLRGKVVLVDFWTFACVNCANTLPHVVDWYRKYQPQGLVVVGIHTPEFAFEKVTANVQDALKRFDIRFPVAQDNRYATWSAYSNQYWPAFYLVDKAGRIRRTHFGEGEYAQTEAAIQALLQEPAAA